MESRKIRGPTRDVRRFYNIAGEIKATRSNSYKGIGHVIYVELKVEETIPKQ